MKAIITSLMEVPIFYKFVQETLAGGGHDVIKKYLKKQIPKTAKKILDQGCGTDVTRLLNCRHTNQYGKPLDSGSGPE